MRGQFIVAIDNLRCTAHLGNGIAINNDLRITNDSSYAKCLKSPIFSTIAGTLETSSLKKANLLVFTEERDFGDVDALLLISRILDIVQSYLENIWIIKDHSAFFDRGYLLQDVGVHSNTKITGYFNAKGERRTVDISRGELETAKRFFRPAIHGVSESYEISDENFTLKGGTTPAQRSIDLPARFIGFVNYSRQSMDLPFRIAMACSALEVLFSTSTNELSHRVSERVAFLLETTPVKRKERYNIVKRLYSIRSAFLHGDSISSKDDKELTARSIEADQTLREVAHNLMINNEFRRAAVKGKDTLEQFHSAQLFGL